MSQSKTPSLIDSIQSEVSKEASPFLEFLIRNSKKLITAAVVLAVLALGYGGWSVYQAEKRSDAREALGMILVQPEGQPKLEALQQFSVDAHAGVKPAALMALAQSAEIQSDYALAAATWSQVADLTAEPMRSTARMAQAAALQNEGRNQEALEALAAAVKNAPKELAPAMQRNISELAEELGQLDQAIAACEAMLASELVSEKTYVQQRIEYLRARQGAAE